MKKLLLATLVTAASIGAAQADGPTLYGKLNVSVGSVKSDLNNKRSTQVDSNASRFGIKGSEKLSDNLSGIYGIEWGYNVDGPNDGSANETFESRNRFIGLQYEGVGALKVGRLDTYVKTAQNGIDVFDDLQAGNLDMKRTLGGENRVSNVVALETAKFNLDGFGALQGNIMLISGEKAQTNPENLPKIGTTPSVDTTNTGANGSNKNKNGVSASVVYTNKDIGLYTALAYDSSVVSTWNAVSTFQKAPAGSINGFPTDTLRWIGSLDLTKAGIDGLSLNALFQSAELSDDSALKSNPKETAYLVSAVYKFPASVLDGVSAKIQWQNSTTKDLAVNASDVEIDQLGTVVDYAFSSKTKVYGYWAKRTLKNPANTVPTTTGKDTEYAYSAFGLGLEQKF